MQLLLSSSDQALLLFSQPMLLKKVSKTNTDFLVIKNTATSLRTLFNKTLHWFLKNRLFSTHFVYYNESIRRKMMKLGSANGKFHLYL
jgi:hypothetical protein